MANHSYGKYIKMEEWSLIDSEKELQFNDYVDFTELRSRANSTGSSFSSTNTCAKIQTIWYFRLTKKFICLTTYNVSSVSTKHSSGGKVGTVGGGLRLCGVVRLAQYTSNCSKYVWTKSVEVWC